MTPTGIRILIGAILVVAGVSSVGCICVAVRVLKDLERRGGRRW